MLLYHSFRFQPRTLLGSGMVVCYRLASRSHGTPDWIVLRPVFPGTQHWEGLKSILVAVLYAALTMVQHNRLVLPHNSIQGLHFNAMGATRTQFRTLLTLMVLCVQALRPTIKVYMHECLRLKDYTATVSAASRLKCSIATCTIIPSCQPTKRPLTLHSSIICELMAGAHALCGWSSCALWLELMYFLASEHSWLFPCHFAQAMSSRYLKSKTTAAK